jgi:hypothetical protein
MVIYRTRCREDNPAGSKVCLRCGAKLEADNGAYIAKLSSLATLKKVLNDPNSPVSQRAKEALEKFHSARN